MRRLLVRVDSHLAIGRSDLKAAGLGLRDVREPFEYDNPEFWKRERLGFFTGDTPRKISLVEADTDEIRLPRGVLVRLLEILARERIEPEFVDETVSGTAWMLSKVDALSHWVAPFELDPDQRSAAKACVRRRTGLVVGPCASGKTEVALKAISLLGEKAIVVVHTERILKSWIEKATERFPRARVGAFYGKRKQPDSDVVVGMVRTVLNHVRKEPNWTKLFGTFVLDEAHHCFPAGTQVDGRPIETHRRGDLVASFDESTLEPCRQPVEEVLVRPVDRLVRVVVGIDDLAVDPEHPFFTPNGWLRAGDLQTGGMVLGFIHRKEYSDEHMQLWEAGGREGDREVLRGLSTETTRSEKNRRGVRVRGVRGVIRTERSRTTRSAWSRLLLEDVQGYERLTEIVTNDEGDEPQTFEDPLRADEEAKPDARPESSREGFDYASCDGLGTDGSRWKRSGSNSAATPPRMHSRLGDGSRDRDGDCSGEVGLSDVLQGRRRESGSEDRDRGRRKLSRGVEASEARREEGLVPTWVRVDRAEVLEPGSDGTFGGRAPDGLVYNLRVRGTETFLVGRSGIGVHNCPATTFSEVVSAFPARNRLAFTATPRRKDAKETLLYDAFGAETRRSPKTGKTTSGPRVLFRITDEMLERFGRIMPIEVVVVPTEFYFDLDRADELAALDWTPEPRESTLASVKRWVRDTADESSTKPYAEMLDEMVRDRKRQARILSYLLPEIAAGRPSMLLADRREFCLELRNWLRRRNVDVGTLMGGKNRRDADRTEDALNAGKLLVAVGTTVADEGMDVGCLARGFGCTPVGSNPGRLTQQFGRFKRLHAGKADAKYFYFWDRRIVGLRRHLRTIANVVGPPHTVWWSEKPGKQVRLTKRLISEIEQTHTR